MRGAIRSIRLRNRRRAIRHGYRVWRSAKLISFVRKIAPKKFRAVRRKAEAEIAAMAADIIHAAIASKEPAP